MWYFHSGNEVCNGCFINDFYKVNAVGQWAKIMITVVGFANTVGQWVPKI